MVAGEGQPTVSRPSSSSRREPSSSADAYAPLPRLKRLLSIRSRQARSSPDQREGEGSRKDEGGSSNQRRADEMESGARVYPGQQVNASPRQAADETAIPEASSSRAAQVQMTPDLAADPLASTRSEHSILFYHRKEGTASGALGDDKALPSLPEEQSRTMLRKFSLRRWVGKKPEHTPPPSSSRDSQYHYQRRRSQSQPHLDLVPPASTPPLEPPCRPSLPSNNSAPAPVVPRKPVPRLDERVSRDEPRGLGLTLGKPSSLVSSQGQRAVGSSDPNSSMSSGQRASSGGAPRFSLSGSSQHDVMRITTADSDAEGEGGAGGSTSGLMWLQRPGGPRPQPLQPVLQRASVQRSPNFAPAPLSSLRAQMVSPAPTSLGPRASVLSTEGEAGFSSALEAEIGTARKVVGHGRAQEQSILRLVEDNSQDVQREVEVVEEEEAVAPAAAALDDAIKELRAVEQPVGGGEAPRSFVVQARAGGDGSMTSESDADAENRDQAAATLPRPHTRPRSSSVSSAEDGKQARSPGPPPPSAPSSSFFTSLGRSHKRSKSSGVLSSGVPASSVGAASGSMTPRRQQEKDRRERKREREKEKQRVKRYAEMKTRDPLLVERLALMGLKHQPGGEREPGESDAAQAGVVESPAHAAAGAGDQDGVEGPRAASPSVSPSASIHTAKSRFASTSRPNTAGSSYAPARAHADLVSTPSADIISPATGASELLLRARRASLDEAAREVLARKTSVKASASQPPLLVRKVSSGTPRQAPKHLSMEAAIEDLPPPTTPTR